MSTRRPHIRRRRTLPWRGCSQSAIAGQVSQASGRPQPTCEPCQRRLPHPVRTHPCGSDECLAASSSVRLSHRIHPFSRITPTPRILTRQPHYPILEKMAQSQHDALNNPIQSIHTPHHFSNAPHQKRALTHPNRNEHTSGEPQKAGEMSYALRASVMNFGQAATTNNEEAPTK